MIQTCILPGERRLVMTAGHEVEVPCRGGDHRRKRVPDHSEHDIEGPGHSQEQEDRRNEEGWFVPDDGVETRARHRKERQHDPAAIERWNWQEIDRSEKGVRGDAPPGDYENGRASWRERVCRAV